jgi:Zn-dependent protease
VQVKLGRISDISVGLHYSWFVIALLIVLSLAERLHAVNPHWSDTVLWSVAIVTVLFFVALLLHEAGSLVVKAHGLRVRVITLFVLGGVSQIESEASDAKDELWIAIAGPITSIVIGFVVLAVARLAGWRSGTEPATPVLTVLLHRLLST